MASGTRVWNAFMIIFMARPPVPKSGLFAPKVTMWSATLERRLVLDMQLVGIIWLTWNITWHTHDGWRSTCSEPTATTTRTTSGWARRAKLTTSRTPSITTMTARKLPSDCARETCSRCGLANDCNFTWRTAWRSSTTGTTAITTTIAKWLPSKGSSYGGAGVVAGADVLSGASSARRTDVCCTSTTGATAATATATTTTIARLLAGSRIDLGVCWGCRREAETSAATTIVRSLASKRPGKVYLGGGNWFRRWLYGCRIGGVDARRATQLAPSALTAGVATTRSTTSSGATTVRWVTGGHVFWSWADIWKNEGWGFKERKTRAWPTKIYGLLWLSIRIDARHCDFIVDHESHYCENHTLLRNLRRWLHCISKYY